MDYYDKPTAQEAVRRAQDIVAFVEAQIVGYDRVARLDPEGIVQPIVFGTKQFLEQLAHANALALEICHDGIALAGRKEYLYQVALNFARVQRRYTKTATGWIRTPSQRSSYTRL